MLTFNRVNFVNVFLSEGLAESVLPNHIYLQPNTDLSLPHAVFFFSPQVKWVLLKNFSFKQVLENCRLVV